MKFEMGNPALAGSGGNGGNGRSTCKWTQYDEDSFGLYETGCEHLFEVNNGTPSENNMKYCCYCGREIEVRNEKENNDRKEPTK